MIKVSHFITVILVVLVPICVSNQLQGTKKYKLSLFLRGLVASGVAYFISPMPSHSGMLTFPLPSPLKNNIVLVRSGESFADERHEIETNPVKKLRQDNALTFRGREEAIEASRRLKDMGFSPTFIWTSNTERAYETSKIIASECEIGQNRIVPEYSFLDARAAGIFEGTSDSSWDTIHEQDTKKGNRK